MGSEKGDQPLHEAQFGPWEEVWISGSGTRCVSKPEQFENELDEVVQVAGLFCEQHLDISIRKHVDEIGQCFLSGVASQQQTSGDSSKPLDV